jgi:hypothetical protein
MSENGSAFDEGKGSSRNTHPLVPDVTFVPLEQDLRYGHLRVAPYDELERDLTFVDGALDTSDEVLEGPMKGAFGEVHRAEYTPSTPAALASTPVCVKRLTKRPDATVPLTFDEYRRACVILRRELTAACRCAGAACVVQYVAIGTSTVLVVDGGGVTTDSSPIATTFERVMPSHVIMADSGNSLRRRMDFAVDRALGKEAGVAHQPISEWDHEVVLRALICALMGLSTMHRCGMAHRDFKPGNVVMRVAGGSSEEAVSACLVDLGLCRAVVVPEGSRSGTRGYMAPEQGAERANEAVDVWAFGCVVLRWLHDALVVARGRCNPPVPTHHQASDPVPAKQLIALVPALRGIAADAVTAETVVAEGAVDRLLFLADAALVEDPCQRPGADRLLHLFTRRYPHYEGVVERSSASGKAGLLSAFGARLRDLEMVFQRLNDSYFEAAVKLVAADLAQWCDRNGGHGNGPAGVWAPDGFRRSHLELPSIANFVFALVDAYEQLGILQPPSSAHVELALAWALAASAQRIALQMRRSFAFLTAVLGTVEAIGVCSLRCRLVLMEIASRHGYQLTSKDAAAATSRAKSFFGEVVQSTSPAILSKIDTLDAAAALATAVAVGIDPDAARLSWDALRAVDCGVDPGAFLEAEAVLTIALCAGGAMHSDSDVAKLDDLEDRLRDMVLERKAASPLVLAGFWIAKAQARVKLASASAAVAKGKAGSSSVAETVRACLGDLDAAIGLLVHACGPDHPSVHRAQCSRSALLIRLGGTAQLLEAGAHLDRAISCFTIMAAASPRAGAPEDAEGEEDDEGSVTNGRVPVPELAIAKVHKAAAILRLASAGLRTALALVNHGVGLLDYTDRRVCSDKNTIGRVAAAGSQLYWALSVKLQVLRALGDAKSASEAIALCDSMRVACGVSEAQLAALNAIDKACREVYAAGAG